MTLPENLDEFKTLVEIIARLRAPDGCPWDRRQTHSSLRESFLQECYEVLAVLDKGDVLKLREELGDVLLHIIFQVQIATESGEFTLADVLNAINKKLIHRHPHVFGSAEVKDAAEVAHNWEALKQEEKGREKSILSSVPEHMPALGYSQEIQHRVAEVGFDWEDDSGVIDKLTEEVKEFNQAEDQQQKEEEYGDLMFTLANIARRQNIDLESALREANRKFFKRFTYMEEVCQQRGVNLSDLSFDEQNALWEEAKKRT